MVEATPEGRKVFSAFIEARELAPSIEQFLRKA